MVSIVGASLAGIETGAIVGVLVTTEGTEVLEGMATGPVETEGEGIIEAAIGFVEVGGEVTVRADGDGDGAVVDRGEGAGDGIDVAGGSDKSEVFKVGVR